MRVTTYFYDPLGKLPLWKSGAQGRWFSYDSLSRLIRARNPEQNCNPTSPPHTDPCPGGYCWSIAYSYDANGNLLRGIDARGIEVKYYYDALNRNIGDRLQQYRGSTLPRSRDSEKCRPRD